MKTSNEATEVLPGQITVTRTASGYYLVQIGRLKYTKRFNLSRAEAEALIDELAPLIGGAGAARPA
jgi:hypothetical protein